MPGPLSNLVAPAHARIFRITHRDNLPHILANGLHCRTSEVVDPNFVEIGHPDIIHRRASRKVPVAPGGSLADYVPFYFTPCTPMLHNIVTGWRGLRQRQRSEIIVLASALGTLEALAIPHLIADRNATLVNAVLAPGRALLDGLPWDIWQNRDFKLDDKDPGKLERYQAELLVHRHLQVEGLSAIITYDGTTQVSVEQVVSAAGATVPVLARPSWYT